MKNFSQARSNMVDCQIHPSGVIMPGLLTAFENMPRERFVPENLRSIAYKDEDLPFGNGRYMLDPTVHARMIQVVEPKSHEVVLDIGGLSGYSAAILSGLVTTVIAIENQAEFLKKAQTLWNDLDVSNVVGYERSLVEGDMQHGPFDIIFLNGAAEAIPQSILNQLAIDGRLVYIHKEKNSVIGQVKIIRRIGNAQLSSYEAFDAGGHYLPGFEASPSFQF